MCGWAHQEEREVRAEFGKDYDRYAATTPAWFPRLGGEIVKEGMR
jgi:protein-S-isoprenylcysteine O-methyltransferase Ste14